MNQFAMLVNYSKNGAEKGSEILTAECKKNGCQLHEIFLGEECPKGIDALICIGGDGTFLKAARLVYNMGIPVLGINNGSMGFLTEIEGEEIAYTVEQLVSGHYVMQKRHMIDVDIHKTDGEVIRNFALNDVVIARGAISRILHLGLYIHDSFIHSFHGDGIIVATPTGSTAYSMSAGGPFVDPDLDVLTLTPICPHNLYSRSMISGGEKKIKIEVEKNYIDEATVTVDGSEVFQLKAGEYAELKRADKQLNMIRIYNRNFYETLLRKIHKREELYNRNEE